MILCGSIAFTCFVRSLSFGTLAALAIEHIELEQSPATLPTGISLLSNSEINEIRFYNNAIQALFVTGDCKFRQACNEGRPPLLPHAVTFLSVYLLLVVVTIETMQVTRQHLYSNNSLRRRWMMVFLVTNSLLYMIQIALYISLFLSPNSGESIITGINIIVAAVNFLLPITLLFMYWILTTCVFAGFPFLSVKAKRRWTALFQLVVGWSFTRLLWGGLAIWAAQRNWNELFFVDNEWAFSLIIATIFTILELFPIAATLATNLTELLHDSEPAQAAAADKPASHGLVDNAAPLPTGGLAPRAGRSGSFSVPEHHLAAAAAVGVIPRGDHIKHILQHSDSSNTLGDLESGHAVAAVAESKAAPSSVSAMSADDFRSDSSPIRLRAATAGHSAGSTQDAHAASAGSQGGYRPASHTGAGHDLVVAATAGAVPFSSAPPSPPHRLSDDGEVQLHVSMDSDDERAEFDAALNGLVHGTAQQGGGIIVRKA